MGRPLVSVIVAVSNGERYLAQALESVLSQTYGRLEVIVVDDGSVDKSDKIARSREEVRYISQHNTGLAVAGNMGSRTRFNYTVLGESVNLAARRGRGTLDFKDAHPT